MFMVPHSEFTPKRGRPVKYPIAYLRVGESLFFPGVTAHKMRSTFRAYQALEFERKAARRKGVRGVLVTRVAERDPDRRRGPVPKFPLRNMQVGESIFCPGETATGMWNMYAKLSPKKFKCRTVMKGGQIGARVWRIE